MTTTEAPAADKAARALSGWQKATGNESEDSRLSLTAVLVAGDALANALRTAEQAAPAAPAVLATSSKKKKPGIYRGGSAAEFGLFRLRPDGVWLFCMPVAGETWKVAGDQSGDKLILLVDETRI